MAFLLLLLAIITTVSNVFGDEYMYRLNCGGGTYATTKYCYLPNSIGPHDTGYYTVELIRDYSTGHASCPRGYYELSEHNNYAAVAVLYGCHGYFGIKPRIAGYPYRGGCGQDNGLGFKIVSGYRARSCQFPWMTYVLKRWTNAREYTFCGGSIVGKKWILTAAHCLVQQGGSGGKPPFNAMTVRTGSLVKNENYKERVVDWYVIHPDFDHRYLHNDIALLRLRTPIKYDGCHAPVCLNSDKNILVGKACIISGWGYKAINPYMTTRDLLWAYDYMLSRETCDRIYPADSSERTICGRAAAGGRGFCSGDSGGPLVCKSDRDGRYFQHGIVSRYKQPYCTTEGIYTSVAYYHDWIKGYAK